MRIRVLQGPLGLPLGEVAEQVSEAESQGTLVSVEGEGWQPGLGCGWHPGMLAGDREAAERPEGTKEETAQ